MFAYLDPATGSMILSALAGGIAGIAVFFRTFGHRVWSTLAFWKRSDADDIDPIDLTTADSSDAAEESSEVGS